MLNLNTEKCNAVYELMRIMSGTLSIVHEIIVPFKVSKKYMNLQDDNKNNHSSLI